jgi:P27 family predicted phage terminase small subunit
MRQSNFSTGSETRFCQNYTKERARMRKPDSLKKLAGTARPDRNRPEPQLERVTRPRCPRDLPEPARPYWRKLAAVLGPAGTLTRADLPALADLCLCLARVAECERDLSEHGLLLPGRAGGVVKNPAATLAGQYRTAALRLFARFGMTPADRSGVGAVPVEGPNLDDLLKRAVAGMAGGEVKPEPGT